MSVRLKVAPEKKKKEEEEEKRRRRRRRRRSHSGLCVRKGAWGVGGMALAGWYTQILSTLNVCMWVIHTQGTHYEAASRGNEEEEEAEEEGGMVMCLLQQFSDSLAFYTSPKVNTANSLQPIK